MNFVDIKGIAELLQAILSLGAVIAMGYRGLNEVRKVAEERKKVVLVPTKTIATRLVENTSQLLNLAFILIFSTFFSLILIDALVISGRNPETFPSALWTITITAFTTSTLIFAWLRGKTELGIGLWAIFALTMLLIAPGGPLFPALTVERPIEGINLWLPVSTLVFLAITAMIYAYGLPVDRAKPLANRIGLALVFAVIILTAILSLGHQYQESVEKDSRTPTISTKETRALIRQINGWNHKQKTAFYTAASDAQLLDLYLAYSNSVSTEISAAESFEIPVDYFLSQGFSIENAEILAPQITEMIRSRQSLVVLTNYLELEGQISDRTEAGKMAQELYSTYSSLIVPSARKQRLDALLKKFEEMGLEVQWSYMADRLAWVHPVGGGDLGQSPLNLPGLTPKDRFEQLDEYRIRKALSLNSSIAPALVTEFDYPQSIISEFSGPTTSTPSLNPVPNIFPVKDELYPQFREQMTLPTGYETYIAFEEYKLVARQKLVTDLESKGITPAKIWQIFDDLDRLKPKSREAFIFHIIKQDPKRGNYRALQLLAQHNVDFSPIIEGAPFTIRELETVLGIKDNRSRSAQIQALADTIRDIEIDGEIEAFIGIQNPSQEVYHLLNADVFRLVKDIRVLDKDSETRERLFRVISDPIGEVIPVLIGEGLLIDTADFPPGRSDEVDKRKDDMLRAFEVFSDPNRTEHEKNGFLHETAVSLYRPQGTYSHNIFALMVIQAGSVLRWVGLIMASLIVLPFVFVLSILAFFTARKLTARDRLTELMITEASSQTRGRFTLGTTDVLHGRFEIIERMKRLAGRGWSSIAIVGRRGVGKTRILYELMRQDQGGGRPTAVTAWITAPSQFDEAEFVESVLERLANDVENAISLSLGAKPLEVRRLEAHTSVLGIIIYAVLLLVLGILFALMSARVPSNQIIITWFPVFLIFLGSLTVLLAYFTILQPVDLTSWLERDRSNSPQTVLLYREARRVRDYVNNRRKAQMIPSFQNSYWTLLRLGFIGILGALGVYAVSDIISNGPSEISIILAMTAMVLLFGLLQARTRQPLVVQGFSLMSLIAEYREFVERMVYRIRHGAFGQHNLNDFEVVVCIDELDKIIESSDLLQLLRRIKAIFEIPGTYYYLSLSEDGLRALYLGAAAGKNEIDSAFDHIVQVPPLDCTVGAEIARTFLQKHSNQSVLPRLERSIAAISFGVPRDIVRRCDEVLTKDQLASVIPKSVIDDLRIRQANLAYDEHLLSKQDLNWCIGYAADVASHMRESFASEVFEIKKARVMLALWVLALLAVVIEWADEAWEQLSERLRDVGYRILDEPIEVIIEELRGLTEEISISPT